MKNTLIIGAGAIGKGVIVPLFQNHDMNIVLANRTKGTIVNPETNSYRIYSQETWKEMSGFIYCEINNSIFIDSLDSVDIIVLTLQEEAFIEITKHIAKEILKRYTCGSMKKLTIIICSNSKNAKKNLVYALQEKVDNDWLKNHVEVLHMLVFVGARRYSSNPYDIELNSKYSFLEMEKSSYSNISNWKEIRSIKNAEHRLLIKLSLINRVQLYLALLGDQAGYTTFEECFVDHDILYRARMSYVECFRCLEKYFIGEIDEEFVELLWQRVLYGDKENINRFLKNIEKKLLPEERICFPLGIAREYNMPCKFMEEGYRLAIEFLEKRK
ncbi:mannitol dehydrogenase family protein [Amedibacillus sp. YH-ame6]